MRLHGRNAISLGDLAIAVKRLSTRDKAHLTKIAGCLGFGLEAVAPPKPTQKGARGKEQSDEQEPLTDTSPSKPQFGFTAGRLRTGRYHRSPGPHRRSEPAAGH